MEDKFSSFGNTPQPQNRFSSGLSIQHSFRPKTTKQQYLSTGYNNIPQLKKQMEEAINYKRKGKINKETMKKYPSEISLMKSGISVLSGKTPERDLPLTLLELQVVCTEQLLALREDKITYMAAYNQAVGERYKAERELARAKKREQKQRETKSQINQLIELEKESSGAKKKQQKKQLLTKNDKLKSQFEALSAETLAIISDPEEQQQLLEQIELMQENCKIMEDKISKIENTGGSSRLLGTDKKTEGKKNKFAKLQATQKQMRYIRKLRQKRKSLLVALAELTQKFDLRVYFNQLITQNRQLRQKSDEIDFGIKKLSALQQMRQQVENEQEEKKMFFDDLTKFKEELNVLKQQNQQFRVQLGRQSQ